MKRVAISQPRYLPAINYFQRIYICDIFVVLDNVQHQRRSFEHRNRIKSLSSCARWLSIPIDRKNSSRMPIRDMRFTCLDWIEEHKSIIRHNYSQAPFFDKGLLDEIYECVQGHSFLESIQKINEEFCRRLNIKCSFLKASALGISSHKDRLLYDIVKKIGGDAYISGPCGRNYISRDIFCDIDLFFHDFEFPLYKQVNGAFLPWMCIWDQIFNIGINQTEKLIKTNVVLNKG